MFEAIRESFDAQSEIGDQLSGQERDSLSKMAKEANEYWKELKADNLEAIRQANRQVPGVRWPAPNIILIVADDLGYGDLGCYGQERIKTPHLDALAAEGVRYTNYYAGSPQDAPSRCSLATGLHTGHARIRGNQPIVPLQPEDCTIAEVLWRSGYTTALVGRWALGDADTTGAPNRQGFEYSVTFANREATPADASAKLLLNGRPYDPAEHDNAQKAESYPPAIVTNEALRVLASDCPRPLFLQINCPLPSAAVHAVPGSTDYDAEDWPAAQKQYAQMVTRLDSEVGRIIDFVKASPERDDFMIFFTSDNGPQGDGIDPALFKSAGPFRAAQGQLWEGGIRIPMIVWATQNERSDRVDDRPWAAWDLLPTLAELAGAMRQPAALDGISQVGLLTSDEQLAVVEVEQTEVIVDDQTEPADAEATEPSVEPQTDLELEEQPDLEVEEQRDVAEVEVTQVEVEPVVGVDGLPVHQYLYWEIHEPAFQQAIRAGRWKGIRTGLDGPLALYDLAADAAETTDVSAANPEIVQRLTAWLNAARTPSPNWPVRGEP